MIAWIELTVTPVPIWYPRADTNGASALWKDAVVFLFFFARDEGLAELLGEAFLFGLEISDLAFESRARGVGLTARCFRGGRGEIVSQLRELLFLALDDGSHLAERL